MKVKIKRLHPNAVIPKYSLEGDAAMDVTAVSYHLDADKNHVYGLGIAIEIPKGYVGLLFTRSSVCKKPLLLSNSVGVIDSGYRSEISMKFKCTDPYARLYEIGDRVGQLIIIPYPEIEFKEVDELSETERGANGYGSTGN